MNELIVCINLLMTSYFIYISIILFFMVIIYYKSDLVGCFLIFFIFSSVLMILISDHLFCIFLALEIQTFCSLILIARRRHSILASEASIKYFIMSSFSSGFFLMGIFFIFSSSFNLNLSEINFVQLNLGEYIGQILILFSLLLKMGCAPTHYWMLDLYESSPWNVLMVIGVLPKISYLYIVIRLFSGAQYFIFFGVLCMLIGCIGAFNQTKIKRLLGYSAINHIGFYIITLVLPCFACNQITYIYFTIYLFTFIFLLSVCKVLNINSYIIELSGLESRNKLLFGSLLILFLSLAGLPPFSGFITKWLVIWQFVAYDYMYISFFMIFFSILAIGFYLNLSKIIWFQENENYNLWENVIINSNKLIHRNSDYKAYSLSIISFGLFLSLFFIYHFDFLLIILDYCIVRCF